MIPDSPACLYNVLEGNIHEFILTEPSRRSVDGMLAIVEALNTEVANSGAEPYRYMIVDITRGLPPINYTFAQMRPLTRKYPQQRASVALISQPNFLLTSIAIMTRAISSIRFFKPEERDQAVAWLRGQASTKR